MQRTFWEGEKKNFSRVKLKSKIKTNKKRKFENRKIPEATI